MTRMAERLTHCHPSRTRLSGDFGMNKHGPGRSFSICALNTLAVTLAVSRWKRDPTGMLTSPWGGVPVTRDFTITKGGISDGYGDMATYPVDTDQNQGQTRVDRSKARFEFPIIGFTTIGFLSGRGCMGVRQ